MSSHLSENAAIARAALESLPPDELRDRKVRAAEASAIARRQARDEAIIVEIRPKHLLSPAQLVAWRQLWATLLDPSDFGRENAAGDQPAANEAEVPSDGRARTAPR